MKPAVADILHLLPPMEGPSLVILKEQLKPFIGQKILHVSGNTKQPKALLKGRTLSKVDTWAKVLFLTFSSPKQPPIVTKTHFMMFGSYRIDDPKENRDPRLQLNFNGGALYFYACSILFDADEYLAAVDREVDIMSPFWNEKHVLKEMEKRKTLYLCDLLLDQGVFAGSGNIIKNEVLFNIRRHPLTKLSSIARKDWPKLARAVRTYGFNFYEWKKRFELRKHWQVYRQNKCPLCERKLVRENMGKWKRRTFYCSHDQGLRLKTFKVHDVLPIKGPIVREERFDH